jgi:hypothetical protein
MGDQVEDGFGFGIESPTAALSTSALTGPD